MFLPTQYDILKLNVLALVKSVGVKVSLRVWHAIYTYKVCCTTTFMLSQTKRPTGSEFITFINFLALTQNLMKNCR